MVGFLFNSKVKQLMPSDPGSSLFVVLMLFIMMVMASSINAQDNPMSALYGDSSEGIGTTHVHSDSPSREALPIVIPNVFTPNGDGNNDLWEIQHLGWKSQYHLTVFDRRGKTVLESEEYHNDWNGDSDGVPLPADTYFYVLESYSTEDVYRGTISLIRP